jgi:BMFP domain-containing protein YqiC
MREVWETFDDLYRAFYRQGERVAELEEKLAQLEKKLTARQEKTPAFANIERNKVQKP